MQRVADPDPAAVRRWWLASIPLALATVGALLVFAQNWLAMAGVWWGSDTFGHGMLIAPISVWLIWRDRARLVRLVPRTSWAGAAAVGLSCSVWVVARLAGVEVLAQFAATAVLPSLVIAFLGPTVAAAIAFPLAFLFFMVPAGEWLNPPLMEATADATIAAVRASGIPVFREGLHFTLPTGRWSVVEACSGLRYVLASAVLASLFAYLQLFHTRDRVLFVTAALAVAVVANWVRSWLIVMLGHASGMRVAVGDDHVVYGWLFYGVVMLAVFRIGVRWRDARRARDARCAGSPPGTSGAGGMVRAGGGRAARHPDAGEPPVRLAAIGVTLALLLVSAPLVSVQLRDVAVRGDFSARAGTALGAFTPAAFSPQPAFPGARGGVSGRLDATPDVTFHLGYFARQHEGREMIGFGNALVPDDGSGWKVLARESRTERLAETSVSLREWRVRSGDVERLLWSWYTVAGVHAGSDYGAKALTAWAMLRRRGDHSTLNVLGTALPALPVTAGPHEVSVALEVARERLRGPAAVLGLAAERVTGP